jgi:transposase
MTAPGVGVVVAASFKAGVDAPERFNRSRNVGVHLRLTSRRYASSEMDGRQQELVVLRGTIHNGPSRKNPADENSRLRDIS